MIKANELRVGNLIAMPADSGKPYWKVLEIRENGVIYGIDWESGTAFCKLDIPDPIPLTPEWLERCGLELRREDKIWQIQVGNTSYLEIEAEEPFMCGVTPETWRDICPIYIWNEIKHVHQLQNLYFTLTGEELTIKA